MPHIAIAGAGLVGSLLAIHLSKRGYSIDVYERRSDMRRTTIGAGRSINLALSHRGFRALQEVGMEGDLRQIGIPMYGRMVHATDGSQSFQPYGEAEQAIFSVSRAELNKKLMTAAEQQANVRFHFDHRCLYFDTDDYELHLQNTATQTEQTLSTDLIIGADGAFSAIRGGMQRSDRFNYSQQYLEHAYKELCIAPLPDGNWAMEKNALHIWPRKRFMLIALPNLDGSFTCTLFLPYQGSPSFDDLQQPDDVLRFFETHFADAIPLMPDLISDFFDNPTSSLVTVRCSPWTKGNRVALIGDAAHAIVPFFGQGMNAGFEDVRVLCGLIDQATTTDGHTDWATIWAQYEHLRQPDANAIADLALQNFIEMRDLVADPNFQLRKKIEQHLHARYGSRFQSLYSLVTFSHTRYSEALHIGKLQDQLFDQILGIEGIAQRYNSPDLDGIYDTAMEAYEKELLVSINA
ncbi:MAG: FAD-dependent monooxygenase [Chitinophagales bacterium]|nr:FAD-dependent monooxygenase [Chitinophagales bacterium]